ncbi:MAG: hypothetical protein K2X73_09940 [Sphingomonas sp.]|uniref:hypothetical protein n=1 Tax=Sphingomonas sp. TaxID=28214 RepID=UPI0025E7B495|nr:hypothetical protein [Sphingomonas sp.]MBX9882281.1 hypothetical protein [Sphingomonas sp.]
MSARASLWLAAPSAYAGLDAPRARAIALIWAVLLLACLAALSIPPPPQAQAVPGDPASNVTDIMLYESIAAGVRGGGNYYTVAADALRRGEFPLKPFVTFRLPTLAMVQAYLPPALVIALLYALAAGVGFAWYRVLRPAFVRPLALVLALVLLGAAMIVFVQPSLIPLHEVWAGPLIALSLALWRPGAARDAIGVALIAMLVRETAALYALVMLGLALIERRRGEAWGWVGALGVLAVVVTCHAWAVSRVVTVDDAVSPGWHGLLGFGYFVKVMTLSTALAELPLLIAAPLVGAALIGWSGWADPRARRVLATIAAYGALLALFARANNFYWGLLAAPTLLIGLAFLPDTVRDLWTSAAARRRITVTRLKR